MKVDIIASNTKAVTFDVLKVGDTFYDYDGELAIKTDDIYCDTHFNSIFFNDGSWFPAQYDLSDKVIPVDSILRVVC